MLGLPYESIFAKEVKLGERVIDGTQLKWSVFRDYPADRMYSVMQEMVFPFIKNLHGGGKPGQPPDGLREGQYRVYSYKRHGDKSIMIGRSCARFFGSGAIFNLEMVKQAVTCYNDLHKGT